MEETDKEVQAMDNILKFPAKIYQTESHAGFACRAWRDIVYCATPVDDIQKLHIFAPECYFDDGTIHGYNLHTAPIFLPNWVGGYMPGLPAEPMVDDLGRPNEVLTALMHGYVVVCAGIRGRATPGNKGKAPALIVDMKAAIRYLRHNRNMIPGDTEKMITSGTSAGGALSALTGASGNGAAYAPYLQAIGAAEERDDIFAANCYCPIINLENADTAYEWQFSGDRVFHGWHGQGQLNDDQMALAQILKSQFPAYLNSLSLQDEAGNALTLDADGHGAFLEYVKQAVIQSAQTELDTQNSATRLAHLTVPGSGVEQQAYLTIRDGKVTGLDWPGYIHAITRMKQPPAFDDLALGSPENDEFADIDGAPRHFTPFAQAQAGGPLANPDVVRLLNPMEQMTAPGCAKHWRIRHGAYDRDTSLAVPVIFAAALRMRGCCVDWCLPWGLPHSGNYDLASLFTWIDNLCQKET